MADKGNKNSLFPSTGSQQRLSNNFSGSPKARNKVMLKPGRSLMDWIRLGRSGADLTGVGGKFMKVTPSELAKHNTPEDAWTVLRGKVYNISPYLEFHPGGVEELMRCAGIDGTELFDEIHKWVNAESMLEKCLVGKLETETPKSINGERKGSKNSLGPNGAVSLTQLKPPEPKTPTYDWFQSNKVVTIVIYTRWNWVTSDHVTISYQHKHLLVTVCMEKHVFRVHIELEEDIETDYTVKTYEDSGKVEITLPKSEPEKQWTSLGKPLRGDMSYVKHFAAEIVFRECVVKSISPVTHDTILLGLTPPDGCRLPVPIGHHVTIKCKVEGMEMSRSYTAVLPSFDKDKQDPDIDIGRAIYLLIKIYSDGAVTPMIGMLSAGDTLSVSNSMGSFQMSKLEGVTHLILFAAGTGFTPMIRLIYHTVVMATKKSPVHVHLVSYNKKMCDILWREQLDELAEKYPSFRVTYVLSAEERSLWDGLTGRICAAHIQNFVPQPDQVFTRSNNQDPSDANNDKREKAYPLACACGVPVFTNTAGQLFKAHGLTPDHIHLFQG